MSKWNKDKEVSLIKQFHGDQMIEYENGVKRYEGGYLDSMKMNYKRQGKGVLFDKSGKAVIYKGDFNYGKRHGSGITFQNKRVIYDGEWIFGMTKQCFYIVNVLVIIVLLIIVIGVLIFNIFDAMALLTLLLIFLVFYLSYYLWLDKITLQCELDYNLSQIVNKPGFEFPYNRVELTERMDIFSRMQTIVIGNGCFESVKTFKIEGLKQLKSLKIGNNSFTQVKKDDKWIKSKVNNLSKSFQIIDCESLEWIHIGEFSFSDCAGKFELKNLQSLRSIQIGTFNMESANFLCCSFAIRGIQQILTTK